jgi:hypothetical protein
MSSGYILWYMHGETAISGPVPSRYSNLVTADATASSTEQGGDMHAMLCDAFGMHDVREDVNSQPQAVNDGAAGGDALKYYELLKTAEKPLHLGTKHSKLSATVHMYNLKCVGGISNNIFSAILELMNQLMPPCDETLPGNTYEAKKFLSDMGLGYEKILECCNDCMLFWKGNKDLDSCIICGESKWKDDNHLDEDGEPISSRKKCPIKVLRWFLLIPGLQRLFMLEHTTAYMRWHPKGRTRDGILRHPADGEAWRSFDIVHPDFMADSRNVRLGLTSDGFNPFGNMSTSHSTWPIMLVPYNLPPWMCMKQTSFILSLVIPGPNSLDMDIDVYIQPLIDDEFFPT